MTEKEQIIELIKREVVPAIGCTEPIAVALAVARATEELGCRPEQITARLSANIIKNAMGVGIPGTGMIGLPIAIALGAIVGKSEYRLEVLRDSNERAVEQGRQYIAENRIRVELKPTDEKLYIEIEVAAAGHTAVAVIAGSHTHFSLVSKDGREILRDDVKAASAQSDDEVKLTVERIYRFATETPIAELGFILEAKKLNDNVSRESLGEHFGHQVGRTMAEANDVYNHSVYATVVARTAAACDARMAGCSLAVMSNSGSGNQGIAATMPVVTYADAVAASEEQLTRALTLSHLTAIYIKQSLGRLSALCGCVVASTGSSAGLVLLMGGGLREVSFAIQNMVATLTGMLCDGAKPSCSLKVASGVSTAVMCAKLAMNAQAVTAQEGIVAESVDQSILNMTRIGSLGMQQTDHMVLDIMTNK